MNIRTLSPCKLKNSNDRNMATDIFSHKSNPIANLANPKIKTDHLFADCDAECVDVPVTCVHHVQHC